MSIELYLPLAFAIALTLLPRVQSGTNILFGIFLAADCALLSFHPSTAVGMALLRGFLGLGLGYLLFVTMKDRPALGFAPFGASSTLVFFVLYLLATLLSDRVWPIGGLVPIIALLIIVSSERSRSILSSGIAVWFGSLTYTIYLFHGPLLEWASNTFGSETLQGNAPLKLALVLLTVVGAWVVSVLVERPAIRLGHRIGSARPQVAGNGDTEKTQMHRRFLAKNPSVLVFLAVLALFSIAVTVMSEGFGLVSTSFVKTLTLALVAVAIDLVWGYAGILRLGHLAFFGLGGYMMGMWLMYERTRLIVVDTLASAPLPPAPAEVVSAIGNQILGIVGASGFPAIWAVSHSLALQLSSAWSRCRACWRWCLAGSPPVRSPLSWFASKPLPGNGCARSMDGKPSISQ